MEDMTTLKVENSLKGRKRNAAETGDDDFKSLEIDINAPEPVSKKALRRAKRVKATLIQGEDNADDKRSKMEKETSKPKEISPRSAHGIWIGNLPFFVTKKDLQAFFTSDNDHAISSDEITRINLPQGPPKPGSQFQNKGFSYIDFVSANAVEKALQLSEKLVGGRRVLIKSSKDFQGRPQAPSKTPESRMPSTKRVFIGNLEFDISKEDLEHHFEICGPIHNVHMATFEDSGKCKGYAWVEFEQLSSAEAAMRGWLEVNDTSVIADKENNDTEANKSRKTKKRVWVNKLGGRKLRMEYAEDKATRYKKRYGKQSRSEGFAVDSLAGADEHAVSGQKEEAADVDEDLAQPKVRSKKPGDVSRTQHLRSGYSASSIQKITGAITDGQGTKITFE
jgi:RNA recognition motif-containing protein